MTNGHIYLLNNNERVQLHRSGTLLLLSYHLVNYLSDFIADITYTKEIAIIYNIILCSDQRFNLFNVLFKVKSDSIEVTYGLRFKV